MSSTPPRERDSSDGPASVVATPQHSAEQLVGQMIDGKYRIDRVIGMGGMGVVVAATQLQLDRTVAIKLVRQDMANDPSAVDQLLREARAAARIVNEHVADVLDFGTLPGGAPFIVMEYLEGEDLAQVLETGGPLPVGAAIDLVLQACEALAEAHLKGIVHRDLKPGNLFISRLMGGSPCLKIVDFGISKRIKSETVHLALTTSPRILGTPNYMAPEQMRGHASGPQADIWALGAIVFELISGRPAFQAETLPRLCQKVLSGRPPSLRQYCPDAPQSLERIILRCLDKDLNTRYQDVSLLARDLAPFGRRRARLSLEHIVAMSPSGASQSAEDIAATVPEAAAHGGSKGVDAPGKSAQRTFQLSEDPSAPGRLPAEPIQGDAADPPESAPTSSPVGDSPPSSTGPHSPSTLADVPHSISIQAPGAARRHQVIALSLAGIVGVALMVRYALRDGPTKPDLVTRSASALKPAQVERTKGLPKSAKRPETASDRPTRRADSPKGQGSRSQPLANSASGSAAPPRRPMPDVTAGPGAQRVAPQGAASPSAPALGAAGHGSSAGPEPTVRPISEPGAEVPDIAVVSQGSPMPAPPSGAPSRVAPSADGQKAGGPAAPSPPTANGSAPPPAKPPTPRRADPWNHETFGPRL